MRILDLKESKRLEKIIIYLTDEEAMDLKSSLEQMLEEKKMQHVHINGTDYTKEITVTIYDPSDKKLDSFDERSKKLILEDK